MTEIGTWSEPLQGLSQQAYFQKLLSFLNQRAQAGATIYPPKGQWFRAFELTNFDQVKVVILGQDPYHNPGQAQGLSFSVPEGTPLPPSLRNIYQEIASDLGADPGTNGDLSAWANQGVLLLNSVLTVEENTPGAHANQGWEVFTDTVIQLISEHKEHVVFLLWGAYAQKKAVLIDASKHLVLRAPHPSPLSAHRGFFGSRHFSQTNDYLKMHGLTPINWTL